MGSKCFVMNFEVLATSADLTSPAISFKDLRFEYLVCIGR
jgi:hypothetical protein